MKPATTELTSSQSASEPIPGTQFPADQCWLHHPEMQQRLARAEADFAAGRSNQTKSLEEALVFLDGLKGVRGSR